MLDSVVVQLTVSIDIDAPADRVWQVITDIENCESTIRGILKVEILEQPKGNSIKGLKWRETRKFAGKEATEVMWITEAQAPRFYKARAESHGSVYESGMSIDSREGGCRLTMSFEGRPQTFGAKVLWALTGWMAVRPLKKTMAEDLQDIKAASEAA